MNRRDLLIIFGVLIWGLYIWLILPSTTLADSAKGIADFATSMILLLLYMTTIVITSLFITKFGKWGDKKIFKQNR